MKETTMNIVEENNHKFIIESKEEDNRSDFVKSMKWELKSNFDIPSFMEMDDNDGKGYVERNHSKTYTYDVGVEYVDIRLKRKRYGIVSEVKEWVWEEYYEKLMLNENINHFKIQKQWGEGNLLLRVFNPNQIDRMGRRKDVENRRWKIKINNIVWDENMYNNHHPQSVDLPTEIEVIINSLYNTQRFEIEGGKLTKEWDGKLITNTYTKNDIVNVIKYVGSGNKFIEMDSHSWINQHIWDFEYKEVDYEIENEGKGLDWYVNDDGVLVKPNGEFEVEVV